MAKRQLWRLALAGLIGIALLAAYVSNAIGPFLNVPTQVTANAVAVAMRFVGIDAVQDGVVVFRSAEFAYEIYYRCIGVLPAGALAIGIFAAPAGWRDKLIGLAVCIPLVLAINLIRLVHLFSIGVNNPEYFWVAHRVLWEAAIVGMTLLIWVLWLKWSLHRRNEELNPVILGQQ